MDDVRTELHWLITNKLCTAPAPACTGTRIRDVTKAVCGAAIGNAATLIQ
jgi:hypothetical protein